MIKKEVRELGEDMISNCENWSQSHYCFGNGKIDIWTANTPILSIDLYPYMGAFNIFEKIYIYRCIKKSRIKKAIL